MYSDVVHGAGPVSSCNSCQDSDCCCCCNNSNNTNNLRRASFVTSLKDGEGEQPQQQKPQQQVKYYLPSSISKKVVPQQTVPSPRSGVKVQFSPDVVVVELHDENMVRIESWRGYSSLSYEETKYELNHARGESDVCSVPAINLTGLIIAFLIVVGLSLAVDKFYESFHDASSMFSLTDSYRSTTSVTIARTILALCILFVVTVWSISAYIKLRYLTPSSRNSGGSCPRFSW